MDAADVVAAVEGVWEGNGRGEFPTIDAFAYRERLEVTRTDESGLAHYRQETWRQEGSGETASHVETGFFRMDEGGVIEVLNAQGVDRLEVLRGKVTSDGDIVEMALHSVELAHDERMMSSWRRLRFESDTLSYEMGMATTAVPEGALHLTAQLTRR